MTKKWNKLADTIQTLKATIKSQLDEENIDFHADLNGGESIKILGLPCNQDSANEYLIEKSDILFWHDPTAYTDEMERWENQKNEDKHKDLKEYLRQSGQKPPFLRLCELIRKQRIAPFIGAGLSKNYGLPLWGEALNEVLNKLASSEELPKNKKSIINEYLKSKKYLDAADELYKFSQVRVENYLLNNFDANQLGLLKKKKNTQLAMLIPEITDSCIVTTNFDDIIEKSFIEANKPIEGYMHGKQHQNQFTSKLIRGERCILKLHGQFDSNESHIFSKEQYDEAYGKGEIDYTKQIPKTLRQIFISHSLLFIGCSLAQDKTIDVFHEVFQSNDFEVPNHFAILPETENNNGKEEYLLDRGIQPIWYKVIDNSHKQLETLLSFAVDCAKNKVSFK